MNNIKKKSLALLTLFVVAIPILAHFGIHTIQSYTDFFILNSHKIQDIFFSWTQNNLGQSNLSTLWRIFPLDFYYYPLNYIIHIPTNITHSIFLFLLLSSGCLSFYFFIGEYFNRLLPQWAVWLSSLFFIFNAYTMINISGSFAFLAAYVVLPLQLLLFIKSIRNKKWFKYLILLAIVNAAVFGVNLAFAFIDFGLLLAFGFWEWGILHNIEFWGVFKRILIGGFFSLLLCVWWFYPLTAGNNLDRQTSSYVLNSEGFYNLDSRVVNIFRNFGDWGFFSGYKGQDYRHYAHYYRTNALVIFSTFSFSILILISCLVFLKNREKRFYKKILFFYLLIFALLPVIGGTNISWPTRRVAIWIFANVPLALIFRNTYKFMSVVLFCYATILALFIGYLVLKIRQRKLSKTYEVILGTAVLSLIIISTFPFWTGNLYENSSQTTKLPYYWNQSASYVNQNLDPSKDRILLLPNQYFPVFQWPEGRKSFPGEFTTITFNTPVVFNTCKGCGQYYTSLVQKYIYDNLEKKNFDKYLGLINISTLLQRNDYDYKYYNVQSPDEIKSLISTHHNVQLGKTIGKLDFYNLKNSIVYPRIYSPDRAITVDTLDDALNSFDDFNQQGHKNAIVLTAQLSKQDKITPNNSNGYFKLFNQDKANIRGDTLEQFIDIRQDSRYQLIMRETKNSVFVKKDKDNNKNVDIANQSEVLHEGKYEFSTQIEREKQNLISNGSFEHGNWQKTVGDCQQQIDNPPVSMKLVNDSTQGSRALQLSADLEVACNYSDPIKNFDKNKNYVASFDYKILKGKFASYCIWDGNSCINSREFNKKDSDWHHIEISIEPNQGSKQLIVFLYASAADGTPATIRYDNVSIRALKYNVLSQFSLLPQHVKFVDPLKISSTRQINPTHFQIQASIYTRGLLVFQESFHAGWRAFIRPTSGKKLSWWEYPLLKEPGFMISGKNHIITNGFGNGWWIDPAQIPKNFQSADGNYQITLEFWPQRWFYVGSVISGSTFILCIAYLIYDWRKKSDPTPKGNRPKFSLRDSGESWITQRVRIDTRQFRTSHKPSVPKTKKRLVQ